MGTQAIDTWNERRVDACQEILRRYDGDGEAFLQRIVTGDESSVHFYEPERKRQSMEWRHTSSPKSKKVRVQQSAGSHAEFLLGLQRADLRAHAQRKHCDQCHLLHPGGKSEATYSPETARFVDDGSVTPPRKCEATYCYSNSVDYWRTVVWLHPTSSVLTQPCAVGFSRLRSIEGCAEWNAFPGRRRGSVAPTKSKISVKLALVLTQNMLLLQLAHNQGH
jgi:hypothetical protein